MIELTLAEEIVYRNSIALDPTVTREQVRAYFETRAEQTRGKNDAIGDKAPVVEPGIPLSDATAAAMCRGWNDYRTGFGVVKLYETATEVDQRNYELGRAFAAVVKRIQGDVPPWPPQMTYRQIVEQGRLTPEAHKAVLAESDWHLKDAKKPVDTSLKSP